MAHNIQEHDKQQGVKMAWHGLTEIIQDINLDDCFLAKWDVSPTPLYTFDKDGNKVDSTFQIFKCNDNDLMVGRPFQESYYPINNQRFLGIVRDSLSGTKHKIVSVGSVRNRGRIFISVELNGLDPFEVDGKRFESFFNLGSSHDQSCVFYGNTSNTCTVCDNTFTANLMHKGKSIDVKIKHRPNAGEKLDNLPQIIDAAIGVQAEFKSALESIKEMPVEPVAAMEVFTGFETPLTSKKDEALSTRTTNKVDRLMQLFRTGAGNRGQSRLDMFQAVTDFYSHESSGGENKWKQFVSSEFGTGAARKQNFLKVMTEQDRFEKVLERGKAVRQATKDKLQLV